jgi:hypothetical protein
MKKTQFDPRCAAKALMARHAEKLCRCYDNGGESIDRYTVVYTGRYRHLTGGVSWYVGMNSAPFHPQDFGQQGEGKDARCIDCLDGSWGGASIGRSNHLGKRIPFAELPEDCQRLVVQDLVNLWGPIEK